jgi:hypothetical protein
VHVKKGVYLICNNGYVQWLEAICPYSAGEPSNTLEGYFSTNLESIRKDVECTFGILKKIWHILNNGMMFRDIAVWEKIFVTCCCLHIFLINLMERNDIRVGRGAPLGEDGVWLDGHTTPPSDGASDRMDAFWFGQRRILLAMHLKVFWEKGPIKLTCG